VSELEAQLRQLVADHLDIDPARLVPDALLGEDLCLDSLAATEMTLIIEDEFDVSIPDELREEVTTYGDVVTLLRQRLAARLS
jgi:acyl carrier protein